MAFSVFSLFYMTFLQTLKITEDHGKLKLEKGSLCHIMCSSKRLVNTAWRCETTDVDIGEIRSENLVMVATKIVL